jgi:hypothetical protein
MTILADEDAATGGACAGGRQWHRCKLHVTTEDASLGLHSVKGSQEAGH